MTGERTPRASWTASREDVRVSLRSSVDEAIKLLALKLTLTKMELSMALQMIQQLHPKVFFAALLWVRCWHFVTNTSMVVSRRSISLPPQIASNPAS